METIERIFSVEELSTWDAREISGGDEFMHDVGYAIGAYARWYIETTRKGLEWLF